MWVGLGSVELFEPDKGSEKFQRKLLIWLPPFRVLVLVKATASPRQAFPTRKLAIGAGLTETGLMKYSEMQLFEFVTLSFAL